MSEDTYFVVSVSCDGAYLQPYTKEKLLKEMDEGDFNTRGDQELLDRIPSKFSWDLTETSGLLIIKGKIVTPGEAETVVKHTLE